MAEYIERSEAVNALISVENRYNRNRDRKNVSAESLYRDLCDAEILIGKTTASDVAPVVHGRWVDAHACTSSCKCTICGAVYVDETVYCPSCGAKMDLKQ